MSLQQYRRDYDGEFVVTATKFENGRKTQEREWVPNPIANHHISGRAAVIGSRIDQESFDYRRLSRHRGGLMGCLRLQTYGTADLWRDMQFDFFTTYNKFEIPKIAETDYPEKSTVYTSSRYVVQHPGRFFLVPFQPRINNLALPLYLAAFDGHREIFLLGYNQETRGRGHQAWVRDVNQVFESFCGTKFWLIGFPANMYDQWRNNRNVDCMSYRKFITYCDI
jgi:hypothetical protein